MKPRTRNGVVEYGSDGWTPDRASRRIPAYRVNCVAAAVLRHSRIPGKSHGRCGKRPYHASGGVVRCRRKAGGDGKRWVGRRVDLGKGGQKVGKWTGFSHFETALPHLFPHDSTQVVDFPHICSVRLFQERSVTAEFRQGNDRQRNGAKSKLGGVWLGGLVVCELLRVVTRCFAKVREVSRKSTKVRTDQGRGYAMLRIVTGGTFFFEIRTSRSLP